MCGFAGFTIKDDVKDNKDTLKKMTDAIAHRGPDDEGFYLDSSVALGFRRLSIIDLAKGRQPISNEDGTVTAVFNGEIYNFQEIRSALIERGHVFKTESDSEVLVHGYEEFGEKLPEKLIGMYAFVIRDTENDLLFG
ncbi:MAG: asparagine synthetase B, partial [Clostridia bacterium]|nr:asparagine synthetase B [Clostridia bacterium]